MNRRFIGISIIILAIILIIAIIYFVFFYDFSENKEVVNIQTQETPKVNLPTSDIKNEEQLKKIPVVKKEDVTSGDLKRIALSFSERFGSYSNHSDFRNILDLKIFMTKKMQTWADLYVKELKEKSSPEDIYYGVTTKSVTSEELSFDDYSGRAELLIKTQRKESTGTMKNSRVYYQDIIISFVMEDDAWKVNSAYWQK